MWAAMKSMCLIQKKERDEAIAGLGRHWIPKRNSCLAGSWATAAPVPLGILSTIYGSASLAEFN